jgi:hypothetical protein
MPVSADDNRGAITDGDQSDVGPEFRLPRSTGDLSADWRAAEAAVRAAGTDDQRASVRLRMTSLAERQRRAAVAGRTV